MATETTEDSYPLGRCTFCDAPAVRMRDYGKHGEFGGEPRVVRWCAVHLPRQQGVST